MKTPRKDPTAVSGVSSVRNRRGDSVRPSAITATTAKNEFGRVLDEVLQGGMVVVTKHDAPKAVILSVEDFNALASDSRPSMDALTEEFDAMLARMQTKRSKAGMKALFEASPEKLGKAAVRAAKKRA